MRLIERAAVAAITSVVAVTAGAAQAQAGQPVPQFFDDFLFDNAGQPGENLNNFILWNVSGGSVDLVGGNLPGAPLAPPANPLGRFVDLGGSTGDPGRFETRLALPVTAATSYTLNFDYRSTGGDLATASVFVGDQSFTFSTASTDFTRFSQTFSFVPTLDTVTIAFQGLEADTDNSGIGIDLVQFGPTLLPGGGGGGAVPEPATWAMLMLGVGATGAALRRRGSRRTAAA